MKRRFIDDEASDEDGEGEEALEQEDDQPTAEDLAFIDDGDHEDAVSECSAVHDSEKEVDEDDLTLLEDNRRAERGSRISRVEDSDSDSFIEDDVGGYGDCDSDYGTSCDEEPCPPPRGKIYIPRAKPPVTEVAVEEAPRPVEKVPPPPIPQFTAFREPAPKVVAKPVATWDFMLKAAQPSAAKKPRPAKKSKTPGKPAFHEPMTGMVRTAEGLFFIAKNGNRFRVENGSLDLRALNKS